MDSRLEVVAALQVAQVAQIQAVAVAVWVFLFTQVAQVVLESSFFAIRVANVAQAELLHRPVATPFILLHHLVRTQHDRRTQTSSCYVSERLIDAL
jgi:hypothetical protein